MQIERGTPHVLRALDEVAGAHRLLRGAAQVEWRSGAADRFRAAIEEAEARVRSVQVAIEEALRPVGAADADAGAALVGPVDVLGTGGP
jgi:hypothetical protein